MNAPWWAEGGLSSSYDIARLRREATALLEACNRALGEMGESVAADCSWCNGEGGWTDDTPPRMTPVRHREGCPITFIRAAVDKAEGQ